LNDIVPSAEVQMGEVLYPEGEPLGTVAFPVRDQMHTNTVLSLISTDWRGLPVDRRVVKGNVLTLQRNALVARMRGDWILFIDSDMYWQPDAVRRLIESKAELENDHGVEVDVLGALCFRRGFPHQPTLYRSTTKEGGPYRSLEQWAEGYVEVDATGMAFALVTKMAFERIAGNPMPSYEERREHDRHPDFFTWHGAVGEDLRFCQNVRKAGGRIFVDTRIEIGHMTEMQVDRKAFLLQLANRDEEAVEHAKEVNTSLGLPTVTPEEAKAELRERYG